MMTSQLQLNAVLVVVAMLLVLRTSVLMTSPFLTQVDSHVMLILCSQVIVVSTMTMILPQPKPAAHVKIMIEKALRVVLVKTTAAFAKMKIPASFHLSLISYNGFSISLGEKLLKSQA